MTSEIKNRKWIAIWLGVLQIFIGIGALPAGIVLITDPSGSSLGMPLENLINSPFSDFLVPGIFLLVVNGIGSLIGGSSSFLRYRLTGEIAIGLGMFLIFWIVAQVWWMEIHWLHALYFILGAAELSLGLILQKNMHLGS